MSKGDRTAASAVRDTAGLSIGNSRPDHSVNVATSQDPSYATKQVKANIEYLLNFYQQSEPSEKSVRQSETLITELSKRLNVPTLTPKDEDLQDHQPPTTWSFADDGTEGLDQRANLGEGKKRQIALRSRSMQDLGGL